MHIDGVIESHSALFNHPENAYACERFRETSHWDHALRAHLSSTGVIFNSCCYTQFEIILDY